MDWLALIVNIFNRIPFERILIPPPDHTKALEEFANSAGASKSQKEALPEEKTVTTIQTPSQPSGPSLKETVDYQNREIGKLLLRMEGHYVQKLRINGIPCDCGSGKHLLDLESLCEETIPMVDNPQVHYRILAWVKEVGPKSTDKAAKSGLYDEEYPLFSHQARDFRKEIIGSLDPQALFPQTPGEPEEGTRILPVVSEQEREEIKQKAIKKIDEVLGNVNQ